MKNLVAGLLAESKSAVDTLQNIPVALQKKIDAMRTVTATYFGGIIRGLELELTGSIYGRYLEEANHCGDCPSE